MTLMNNESKTVRKIAMTAKGTGQKVLSFLDLQKIEISIPSLEEQQKIADFLSSVDDIYLCQRGRSCESGDAEKSCDEEDFLTGSAVQERGW